MVSTETIFEEEVDDLHHLKLDKGKVDLRNCLSSKGGRLING